MKRENKTIKSANQTRQGDSKLNQRQSAQPDRTNTVKDPEEWTTGDEEMTGAQRSYLKTLSDEAGVEAPENLSKAEASRKIEELQHKTGRGQDH